MLLVVSPLALVRFAFYLCEFAKAVGSTKVPITLVRGAVAEVHRAFAVTETSEPFTLVGGSGSAISVRPLD